MAVEHTPGATVYTGDDIHKFRIVTVATEMHARLQGITLRRGRSIFTIVKSEFGLCGNHRAVYEQFCRMHGLEPRP